MSSRDEGLVTNMHVSVPDRERADGHAASAAILILLGAMVIAAMLPASPAAAAQNGMTNLNAGSSAWREEFDDICARVETAADMSLEDLERTLLRCRMLDPKIDELPETLKKVFRRKLSMCRDLYRFVLDSRREKDQHGAGGNTALSDDPGSTEKSVSK